MMNRYIVLTAVLAGLWGFQGEDLQAGSKDRCKDRRVSLFIPFRVSIGCNYVAAYCCPNAWTYCRSYRCVAAECTVKPSQKKKCSATVTVKCPMDYTVKVCGIEAKKTGDTDRVLKLNFDGSVYSCTVTASHEQNGKTYVETPQCITICDCGKYEVTFGNTSAQNTTVLGAKADVDGPVTMKQLEDRLKQLEEKRDQKFETFESRILKMLDDRLPRPDGA